MRTWSAGRPAEHAQGFLAAQNCHKLSTYSCASLRLVPLCTRMPPVVVWRVRICHQRGDQSHYSPTNGCTGLVNSARAHARRRCRLRRLPSPLLWLRRCSPLRHKNCTYALTYQCDRFFRVCETSHSAPKLGRFPLLC